jgi:hypothetical protein
MRASIVKDDAMRWFMLLVAIAAFTLAYSTKSAGLLGLCLLIGFVGLVISFLGFAAARVAATARPDAALLTDRDIATLRASMKKPQPPRPPAPPTA